MSKQETDLRKGTETGSTGTATAVASPSPSLKSTSSESPALAEARAQVRAEAPVEEAAAPSAGTTEPSTTHTLVSASGFALHSLLVISERIVNAMMNLYKNIFVIDSHSKLNYYTEQGYRFYQGKNYAKAAEFLELSLANGNSGDGDLHFCLGLCLKHMEKLPQALNALRQAESLNPKLPGLAAEISDCLIKSENYADALKYLRTLLKQNPGNAQACYLLGMALEKTGVQEEAIDMYKRALDANPKEPLYYHALGFAYETANRHQDAIDCFKKAMALEMSNR
ncbi:MAG: tetratricopeptide repeat protein [Planctomycetes bacterium]|nr:tetratricopeptide repeat protein [Planctomycetota bacterium]